MVASLTDYVPRETRPSDLVPKDLEANLEWRINAIAWSWESRANQECLFDACNRDPVFFTDTFVWALDVKRYPDEPDRPFITWSMQDEVIRDLDASIGRKSVGIVKSRDIGGSTMPLIVFLKHFLFSSFTTLMVASRNEKLVDDPANPDSLFYKLDYAIKWLPSWLTRSLTRKKLTLSNSVTGSNILGSSTTGDLGRGGRKHAVLVDEHAAWDRKESIELLGSLQHNTKCRIWVSTPKGIGNGFHQVISAGNITVHDLAWQKHPIHGAGLYTSKEGSLELLDREYWRVTTPPEILSKYPELGKNLPPSDGLAVDVYPFILDGKERSPYYDYECLMAPFPALINQELDRDFIGSGSRFFGIDEIRDYIRSFGMKPLALGELTYEAPAYAKIQWAPSNDGRLQLWFRPNRYGETPKHTRFVMGVDICAGRGISNSHASVGDCMARSKAAGFTTAHMGPYPFAEYVYALGRWFNNALIVFEGSGPGVDFGARLKELGYPNLWYQKRTTGGKSEHPGFYPNEDSKRTLLSDYDDALRRGDITNRDAVAVRECEAYEWTPTGAVAHSGAASSPDPSGAKKAHGDRVIADALMWMLMKATRRPESPEILKQNTMAAMFKELEEFENRGGTWSPREDPRSWCLVGGR